jgi:3-oxoacyl-[acyl-carrier protein] reductase
MKKLIITGACGSIGSEIVRYFSHRYQLICIDIDKSKLEILKKKFKKIQVYTCDLTNKKKVDKLFDTLNKKHKNIDILINNAGKIFSRPIIKISGNKLKTHNFYEWKNVLNINLNSIFLLSTKVIENFCEYRTKGVIINISSISARGNIGQSAYSVAKSGVEVLTKIWAQELSSFNIRVACIAPGFFNTKSTFESLNDYQISHLIDSTPSKRLGSTKELITAINFIIKNKFYNGKILSLDGGLFI